MTQIRRRSIWQIAQDRARVVHCWAAVYYVGKGPKQESVPQIGLQFIS